MNDEKKNVPKLRFKGFTNPWEKRKLGEELKFEQPSNYIVSSTAYSNKVNVPVLTAGKSFLLGYTDEKFGIKSASKSNPVIIFDDFTTSSHLVEFPFKIKSSAIKLLYTRNKKSNMQFMFYNLKHVKYIVENHERHWIATFSKMDTNIPSIEEQTKIGEFLKQLDDRIAVNQREGKKLEQLKKAYLEKMFPKNDSLEPELRFSGFTTPWEKRKLGEELKFEQPSNYIVSSTAYSNKVNVPVLTAGKSFLLGYTDEKFGIKSASKSNPVIIFDDFTTSSHLVEFPFKIKSSAIKLLYTRNKKSNMQFMFYNLKHVKYIVENHERHWIATFSKMDTNIPSIEEQTKIGEFLKQLDDRIAVNQREGKKLEQLKKAYLKDMFV